MARRWHTDLAEENKLGKPNGQAGQAVRLSGVQGGARLQTTSFLAACILSGACVHLKLLKPASIPAFALMISRHSHVPTALTSHALHLVGPGALNFQSLCHGMSHARSRPDRHTHAPSACCFFLRNSIGSPSLAIISSFSSTCVCCLTAIPIHCTNRSSSGHASDATACKHLYSCAQITCTCLIDW